MLRSNCYDHLIRDGAKISKKDHSLYRVLSKCVKTTSKSNADVRVTGKDPPGGRRALREGHKNADQEQY